MIEERRSGILVHPTSFPSKYGIGDFGKGAYDFVDFLYKAKQTIWQILPLGHTSFGDSPYQSFSTFAGNPLFISPDILEEKGYINKNDIKEIPNFDNNKIDYGKVIKYKYTVFRKAFKNFSSKSNKKEKLDFKKFCDKNKDWLDDYSLFISLKNYFIQERTNTFETPEYKLYKKLNLKTLSENGVNDCFYGASWSSWPSDIASRKQTAITKWTNVLNDEIEFYKFLQYEFFTQWKELKNYANDKNIIIIGDIPIFVAADSADTWSNRELFYIDEQGDPIEVAGVPPDYFSSTGQLWGNPLYKWEEHEKEEYQWWVKRIENILKIVDIVRIDHFRAFQSYWSIPYGEQTAINGQWKEGPNKALFEAVEKKLGNIKIIAEDLGNLNPEVFELRDELEFPGMKILQFAFGDDSKNLYLPHNYTTSNCIVYTGTHDNDTTLGWYNASNEAIKDHLRRYMNISGENISWDLIRLAFSSCASFVIIPIQDLMNLDSNSRMNIPGVANNNWQFRYENDMLSQNITEKLIYLTELFNREETAIK